MTKNEIIERSLQRIAGINKEEASMTLAFTVSGSIAGTVLIAVYLFQVRNREAVKRRNMLLRAFRETV